MSRVEPALKHKPEAGVTHPQYFVPMVAGMAVLAWGALFWLHGASAQHVHHHAPTSSGTFLSSWILMTAAMMVPTTLPLLDAFRRRIQDRSDQSLLLTLLVFGYALVWISFGCILFGIYGISGRFGSLVLLREDQRLIAAVLFLVAGIFQFLPMKHHCLEKCRSPLLPSDLRVGRRLRWSSLQLGLLHGSSCVGCCWALMLLMFAAGSAHLFWMLVLAIVMAVEKTMPWGVRLARPLGLVFLVSSGILFLGLA